MIILKPLSVLYRKQGRIRHIIGEHKFSSHFTAAPKCHTWQGLKLCLMQLPNQRREYMGIFQIKIIVRAICGIGNQRDELTFRMLLIIALTGEDASDLAAA